MNSRKRQFSNVREEHSSRSVIASRNRQTNRNKIQNPNNPSGNRSRISSHTSHHSQYLCVGCFNQKLSSSKKERERYEKEQQRIKTSISFIEGSNEKDNYQIHSRQFQKVNEYNINKIAQNIHKKSILQKQDNKKKTQDAKKQQINRIKQTQEKMKYQQDRRYQLKKELQKQIQEARKRKKYQAEEKMAKTMQPLIQDIENYQKIRLQRQNQYRNELLSQIKYKQQKKNRQKNKQGQNNIDNQFKAITFAEQRNKMARQQTEKRKKMILEQNKQRKVKEQLGKLQKNKAREIEQVYRKTEEQDRKKQVQKIQNNRRKQIDDYLSSLKQQMQINKVKRQNQMRWLKKQTNMSIQNQKPKLETRQCDSCQKQYPKNYLTRVTN